MVIRDTTNKCRILSQLKRRNQQAEVISPVLGESALHKMIPEGISAVGYDMDSWPDLSSSHGMKTVQNPLGVEVSGVAKENLLKDGPAFSSDEISQLDNGLEIFLNQQEDKEQIGSVDYGWANIGSFDDLDRIFRVDEAAPDPVIPRSHLAL